MAHMRKQMNFLMALIGAMKPVLWLKPLALMLVAEVYALDDFPEPRTFLAGFFIVGPLLWGGLYLLNDITDLRLDRRHPIKKTRPLPSGKISPRIATPVALIQIATAIGLGFGANLPFFICLCLMTLKQLLYTSPPFRFKERFALDILSGSLFNSTLRFLSGWFLVTSTLDLPLLFLVFAETFQVSGFLSHRLHGHGAQRIEKLYGFNSTIARVSSGALKRSSASLAMLGMLALSLCSANSILRLVPDRLGVLPLPALGISATLLAVTPTSLTALRDAEKLSGVEARNIYKYSHVFLFVLMVLLSIILVIF